LERQVKGEKDEDEDDREGESNKDDEDKQGSAEKASEKEGGEKEGAAADEDKKSSVEGEPTDAEKYNASKRQLEAYLESIILYETPFRQCYYLKNEIWQRNIAVYNSYNFFIYFALYAILNKMNLIAIIYWISVWRIVS
jgi:hypothetical protein